MLKPGTLITNISSQQYKGNEYRGNFVKRMFLSPFWKGIYNKKKVVANFRIDQQFQILILLLLNTTCPVLVNSVDSDQLASEEANWSGSALFTIKYLNLSQQPGSSNLIGWKLEIGVAS